MKPELRRKKIGKLLRELRESRGMSRYEVYRACENLTQTQVKDMEDGKRAYTIDSLGQYLEALGIDILTLINSRKE